MSGFIVPEHNHERAQLLYAIRGVMSVRMEGKAFVIPPQRALFIPAGTDHEVSCRGPVSLRTLYIEPSALVAPSHSHVYEVSDLVKALVLTISDFEAGTEWGAREHRIVDLFLDELTRLPHTPYSVSMPTDPRLVRVCEAVLADPANGQNIDAWAASAAMGRRTFTRAFRRETGIGFATWRQQVRLMAALSLLAEGRPVTQTAFDVGYDSPSGFATMFRSAFGVPPSQYLRQDGPE